MTAKKTQWIVACLLLAVWTTEVRVQTQPREWYVAPDGSATNSGTITSPLSLAKALSSTSPAQPGDTISLRGGTYQESYVTELVGTAASPITVRAYRGERAILDGNNSSAISSGYVLNILGAYTWFWGLEVMSSATSRVDSGEPNSPSGIVFGSSHHIKLINMLVHDMPGQGIGFWSSSTDSEIYGSLVYYNGINSRDHGIYAQNQSGTKRITDSFVFWNAGYGFHVYGSSAASLNNFDIEGNSIFDNGAIRQPSPKLNQVIYGGTNARNATYIANATYNSPGYSSGENTNFGYGAVILNAVIEENYFIGGSYSVVLSGITPASFARNVVYGPLLTRSLYSNNSYYDTRPDGAWTLVRPNQYEAGRAHITIYNWAKASSAVVDLSSTNLNVGDEFEIRDAQNFFGAPVVTGTYFGTPVAVPMHGLTPVAPMGSGVNNPAHTAPEFGTFVLLKTSSGVGDTTPAAVSVTAPTVGEVPPGSPLIAAAANTPSSVSPAPAVPATPTAAVSTCSTPDPFVTLGGGVCFNGGWLPPGYPIPTGSIVPAMPAPPALVSGCALSDPFASIGGGVCVSGGWVPKGHRLAGGGD